MNNKEQLKQMRKINKYLRLSTFVLSIVLLITSSINLFASARNNEPEPDTGESTTITTTVADTTQKPSESSTENISSTTTTTTTTSTTTTTTETTTSATNVSEPETSTSKKNEILYKYEKEAQEKGYKNIRNTTSFKSTEKYYFEVKKDAPNKTVSRNSIGFVYDTGVDNYAVCDINGNNVCIPIPSGKHPFITEYYFIKGFVIQTVYNNETYWVLLADDTYIYQAGSKIDTQNNKYQW